MLDAPVSILMPSCNEADVIRDVVEEWVTEVMSRLPEGSEMVFDDCSNDGTTEILQELSEKYPFLRFSHCERDGFLKSALRLYRGARCPLVFFTDSDGQYPASEFWRIAEHIADHDMVHGYKVSRQDTKFRLFVSYVFNRLVRIMFGPGHDVNSAFRLIKRPILDAVLDDLGIMPMMPNAEMYMRLRKMSHDIRDIPIRHRERAFGISRGFPGLSLYIISIRTSFDLIRIWLDVERSMRRDKKDSSPLVTATEKPRGGHDV